MRPYDTKSWALARALAHRALRGVGDASLGEWEEQGKHALHVRRRLSLQEQAEAKLDMRDIRGTEEAKRRAAKVVRVHPELRATADIEVVPI